MVDMEQAEKFARTLCKLKAGTVVGVATFLHVQLHDGDINDKENFKLRDAGDIVSDCIDAFVKLNRFQRRRLLKLMNSEVEPEGDANVTDPKTSD